MITNKITCEVCYVQTENKRFRGPLSLNAAKSVVLGEDLQGLSEIVSFCSVDCLKNSQ